jgi:hypothetical protein
MFLSFWMIILFLDGAFSYKNQERIAPIDTVALATKVFKEETYPYPPLSRRERRKFERDNIKAEKKKLKNVLR